ncbi:MAG: OmpA family protein, partial [Firmicutes bacterium]|nr:OmpA family protein [Bacillota bacterium]
GDGEDVNYSVTVENLTPGSKYLEANLFDEYGTIQKPDSLNYTREHNTNTIAEAKENGQAVTGWIKTLKPNTTYYLCFSGGSKAEYSLRITDPDLGYIPKNEERIAVADANQLEVASDQDHAPILDLNTRYRGKYIEGSTWIAFTTGDKEDVNYSVTLENLTPGSKYLVANLYDEYGTIQKPTELNYNREHNNNTIAEAKENGRAATGWIKTLKPNTTYYLCINGGSKAEYVVIVGTPEESSPGSTTSGGVEGFVTDDGSVVPGTSMTYSIKVPLGTKVFSRYESGYAWLAFTTTDVEDATYRVTAVNCTVNSELLYIYLCDEQGTVIKAEKLNFTREHNNSITASEPNWSGTAATGTFRGLKKNANYYLQIVGGGKTDFSVLVSSPDAYTTAAYDTSSSIEVSRGELDEKEAFYTGTNQNNATLLKTNTRYHGRYEDGYAWVAFTTGELEEAEYAVTLENLTPDSKYLEAYLFDEFGNLQKPDEYNYTREHTNNITIAEADQSGKAATGWIRTLQPNTTYYLRISGRSKAEYMLMIGAPEPPEGGNTIEETEVVIKVPFELNETQVRFVADEAIFIDEAAAIEALVPVAELILEHPDHPILIAGTTATYGSQEGCVKLSNLRAEAVKRLLVEHFGVPETQLITIGLGYEDDPFVRGIDINSEGKFVETEGAKNRRVIVLDAQSDIGRQILGE